MPTRNVVLTDSQAELIERLVSSGRYQNASEVLREGLRLVEDMENLATRRLKALSEAARLGAIDIEAGHFSEFDSPADLTRWLDGVRDEVLRKGARRKQGR